MNIVGNNAMGRFFWDKPASWSYADLSVLWEHSKKKDATYRDVAIATGKTEKAVREKAKELGIQLKEDKCA